MFSSVKGKALVALGIRVIKADGTIHDMGVAGTEEEREEQDRKIEKYARSH